jgi:hypothetical protein
MNIRLGYRLLRDHRMPIRTKLMALGIGAACIGALELLQLPLEAVLAGIPPLIGITGDTHLTERKPSSGPVIIATMLLRSSNFNIFGRKSSIDTNCLERNRSLPDVQSA